MVIAFHHGTAARFYYHNLDMSNYVEAVEMEVSRELAEIKPQGDTNVSRVAGLRSGSVALTGGAAGFAAGESDEWVFSRRADTTQKAFAFLPYGDLLNRSAYLGQVWHNSQKRVATSSDAVRLPVALIGTNRMERGLILRALATDGTSPGSKSPASGGADSDFGGAGYLIVTALTGTLNVIIEHSVNGTDNWATLITFTEQTSGDPLSQVVLTATPTTNVRAYVRVAWTLSANHATFFAAFARRTH